jgi:hypothetical protein
MASDKGVSAVLALLHELYPTRDIGSATLDAWALAFAEWTDDELLAAARRAATTPGRTFFPTPGEIAEMRVVESVVDSGKLLRTIEKMSAYSPQVGMIAPNVQQVRDVHGDAIADAYAAAGGGIRCFANDDTSRSIAAREFHKAMERFTAPVPGDRLLLDSGDSVRRLPSGGRRGPESLAAIVQRALPNAPSGDAP